MKTLDELHTKLDLLAKNQMNLCSAMDLLSQGQARLMARLDDMDRLIPSHKDLLSVQAMILVTVEAGLKGTADGVALAIAELRKDMDEQYRYLVAGIKSIAVTVVVTWSV